MCHPIPELSEEFVVSVPAETSDLLVEAQMFVEPEPLAESLAFSETSSALDPVATSEGAEPASVPVLEQEQAGSLDEPTESSSEEGRAWYWAPLLETVGPELAAQFEWNAETGSIQTYEHRETYRFIHIDSVTRECFNQQREVVPWETALAHALPRPSSLKTPQPEPVGESPAPVTPMILDWDHQAFAGGREIPEPLRADDAQADAELVLGGFIRKEESGRKSAITGFVAAVRKRIRPSTVTAHESSGTDPGAEAENPEPSVSQFIRRTSKLER